MNSKKIVSAFILTCLTVIGCSPLYVTKAGYHQSRLLFARKDISTILNEENTDPKLRQRLLLSQEIIEYAKSIGLNTGDRYSTVSSYKFPALWVVTAAPKFSLTPHTWWFPVIGEVPYKGYFEEEDAVAEALNLNKSGLDVSIRTASAFSTLGWFNDPITTSLLEQEELEFIATLFHELFHATVWVNNEVSFNESFANAFGYWTALEFTKLKKIDLILESENRISRQIKISKKISAIKDQLEQLFQSNLKESDKEKSKQMIYAEFQAMLNMKGNKISNNPFDKTDNNAYLIGLTPYYDEFELALEFLKVMGESKYALTELKSLIKDSKPEDLKIELGKLIERRHHGH